jgi:hypothetical protein
MVVAWLMQSFMPITKSKTGRDEPDEQDQTKEFDPVAGVEIMFIRFIRSN